MLYSAYVENWHCLPLHLTAVVSYSNRLTVTEVKADDYKARTIAVDKAINNLYKYRVIEIGSLIYESYVRRGGIDRFRREVLDGFRRGTNSVNTNWLRTQFERLAIEDESFIIEDNWKALKLEEHENNIFDVLYLLRLLFKTYTKVV
jgi:hypothetical protein